MKIIQIIKELNQNSLRRLEHFIKSSYFNANPKTISLFDQLISSVERSRITSKLDIWEKVFPDTPFNDVRFRKLTHDLLTLIESFFVVENTMKHEYKKQRAIAEYCEEFNITVLKNKLQKRLDESLSQDSLMWSESFFDSYTTYRYLIDIDGNFEKKKNYKNAKGFSESLKTLHSLLDTSYAIEKVRLSLMRNNYSQLVSEEIDLDENIDLDKLIHSLKPKGGGLFSVHSKVFDLLINKVDDYDIESILDFLDVLTKNNRKEAATIYDYLNNFIARKINSGENLHKVWFDLMKFGLESKILIKSNRIDPTDYRNIALAACRLDHFEWALRFIEDYKIFLDPNYKQSAYSFSKARIYRSMGSYENLIDVLRNVEYEDITYNLNSRLMLIMAFYELDEYETLDSTIKSFKVFLRRKRNVSVKRKANFRDFCDVVYNLVRADDRIDTDRLMKAKEILVRNAGIPSSSWLKEKIEIISDKLGIPKQDQPAT